MNAAIIIMTLLGCSDGAATCEYIGTVDTAFQSQAECEARMGAELRHADLADYPSVVAVCEPLPEMAAGIGPAPMQGAGKEDGEHAEPEVVLSQFEDAKRPNPLRTIVVATFDVTRDVVTGVTRVFVKGWEKLSGKDHQIGENISGDTILLGRYMADDL